MRIARILFKDTCNFKMISLIDNQNFTYWIIHHRNIYEQLLLK